MSSNSRSIVLVILLLLSSLNITAKENNRKINDTALMLIALDYENRGEKKNSRDTFMYLLDQYNEYEYLKYALSLSLQIKDYDTILTLSAKYKHIFKEHYEDIARLEIMGLIKQKQLDIALLFSKELLEKYRNATNYENIGSILYSQGRYKESLPYFESAYGEKQDSKRLLNLVSVLYAYLDKKQLAISYLETYLGLHGCEIEVCQRLLVYYQEQKNLDGMVSILKKIYKKYKKEDKNHQSLDKITNTIVEILKIKDIKNAIQFLEENKIYDIKLLTLYHQTKEYKKALALTRKLYRKTKDRNYLAQLAILVYESTDDKNKVLPNVVANFKLALKELDNHQYQNYFGYLLIDHDIDVKKGIFWVKKALEKDPKNIAYRDSLAWGYFKLKQCKTAEKIIDQLVLEVGLEDKELKKHYDMIKGCK